MALSVCPHMTARCPHFRTDCNDSDSSQCHYVANTTSTALSAFLSFQSRDINELNDLELKELKLAKLLLNID